MIKTEVIIIGDGLAAWSVYSLLMKENISSILLSREKYHSEIWIENNQTSFISDLAAIFPTLDMSSIFYPCHEFISAWSTSFSDKSNDIPRFNFNKTKLIKQIRKKISLPDQLINYESIIHCEKKQQHWDLSIETKDGSKIGMNSKLIVDASGRTSSWAIRYGKPFHENSRAYFDDHICLTKVFKQVDHNHNLFCIESTPHGWWYAISIHGMIQFSFICSPHGQLHLNYEEIWNENIALSYYIKGYMQQKEMIQSMSVLDTRVSILQDTSAPGWLSMGDAAYTTDPICGQSNDFVLNQIKKAIPEIIAYLNDNTYSILDFEKEQHRFFINHLKELAPFYKMEKRWPKSNFWTAYE